MDIIKAVKAIEADIIKWRRDLHQIPELGLELPQTIAYVTKVLTEMGVNYDTHYVDGNGIVAIIEGTKLTEDNTQRVLGLRADMDGLPITEETGLPFASQNGNMHACGHDGHTAMLLGAVKLLHVHRNQFSGTVKCLFQPGEEYPGGAAPMITDGALKNPDVTEMMGFHAGEIKGGFKPGQIVYSNGPIMASMDRFLIEINGKGYHGAYPEEAQDPIVAAGQLITAIQTIKSRNFKAVEPYVISITRVTGGFNQNIIPDKVELEGTVRTFNDELRENIHHKLTQIAIGTGEAMDVTCEVTYDYKYPALINDLQATKTTVANLQELFSEDVVPIDDPVMGGEDFACYLKEVPGTFLFLINPGLVEGKFHGHHHPKFDIDEAQLYKGTAAFVQKAINYLN